MGECIQDGGKLCVPHDGLLPFSMNYVVDSCPNAVLECDDGAASPLCPDGKVYSSKMSMCVDDYEDQSSECNTMNYGDPWELSNFVCGSDFWEKSLQFENCTDGKVTISGLYCYHESENKEVSNEIPTCPITEHVNLKTRLCEPDSGCDENGNPKWMRLDQGYYQGWNCETLPDCTTSKPVAFCVDRYEFNFGNEAITLREPVPKQNCINATELLKYTSSGGIQNN